LFDVATIDGLNGWVFLGSPNMPLKLILLAIAAPRVAGGMMSEREMNMNEAYPAVIKKEFRRELSGSPQRKSENRG
jgi:hypothetical protein